MAGYTTVWSVELGRSALKAVRVRREAGGLEILAFDRVDYEVGAEGIDVPTQVKEALSIFVARNGVRDPVVACFPGQNAFSRFIKLPPLETRKLRDMIGYEAQQQIPFPIDEVIWDWHVVDREYLPGEEKEVGIFAVRREAIDDYLIDFSSAGIEVDMITLGYLGLLNYILHDLRPKTPSIVLDMGADHTDLVIVDGRNFWIRTLPSSGNEMTRALAGRFQLSFAEAERLKKSVAQKPDQAARIFQTIQPNLRDLVNEIHRSVGFYKSQAGEVKLETVYLVGNGARLIGARKFLQESLGARVHRIGSLARVRLGGEVDVAAGRRELGGLAAAIGGAVQGCGRGATQVNLIPHEQKVQIEFARKRKLVFAALGALLVFLLFQGLSYRKKLDGVKETLAQTRKLGELERRETRIRAQEDTAAETARLARLGAVGHDRAEVPVALRMIDEVFASFGTGTSPKASVPENQKETALGSITSRASAANGEKVWLLGLEAEKGTYRVGDEIPGAGGEVLSSAARREREALPSIDAVRFTITCGVQMKQTRADSLNFAKGKLAALQDRIWKRLEVPPPPEEGEAALLEELSVEELAGALAGGESGMEGNPLDRKTARRALKYRMGELRFDPDWSQESEALWADISELAFKRGTKGSVKAEVRQGNFYLFRAYWYLAREDPLKLVPKKKASRPAGRRGR